MKEIWEFSKNLFSLFIMLPLYIVVVVFIAFYLPVNLFINLYDFFKRKIIEKFSIEINGFILIFLITLIFGFMYLLSLFILFKIFSPLGNWSVAVIFILGVIVHLLLKRIK